MAEIIGPIGFCFGCIGFLLSTIPTAVKTGEAFLESEDQIRAYQSRLHVCEDKANRWERYWRAFDLGSQEVHITGAKSDIDRLCQKFEEKLKSVHVADQNLSVVAVCRTENKTLLSIGETARRYRQNLRTVSRSVIYALYEKDCFEAWISRLEKSIDAIKALSETEFYKRSAEHFGSSPTLEQIQDMNEAEAFLNGLHNTAESLHYELVQDKTSPKSVSSTTYGWAIALRPLLLDMTCWRDIATVPIELRYSLDSTTVKGEKDIELHILFHTRKRQSDLERAHLKDLVFRSATAELTDNVDGTEVKLFPVERSYVRTRPLGNLFANSPSVFRDFGDSWDWHWRADRAELIFNLINWVLLLWDTVWLQDLCCYGLQLEKESDAIRCKMQVFTRECRGHPFCHHHSSRLRNLGVVLAEIVLATPIRLPDDHTDPYRYEKLVGNSWEAFYDKDIMQAIRLKELSLPLNEAIRFCLQGDSPLSDDPFQTGFIFKCLEKIYAPIKIWYTKERELAVKSLDKSRKRTPRSQAQSWPMGALCQLPETQESEHRLTLHLRLAKTHLSTTISGLAHLGAWKQYGMGLVIMLLVFPSLAVMYIDVFRSHSYAVSSSG